MLYRATHRAVPCRALCCTVLYHAVRCVVLCYTVLYCCTVLHRAVPCYSHTSPLEELQALQLLEEIGSGGHGTVFRGTLRGLEVAVKVCVAATVVSVPALLLLFAACASPHAVAAAAAAATAVTLSSGGASEQPE